MVESLLEQIQNMMFQRDYEDRLVWNFGDKLREVRHKILLWIIGV